MLASLTGDQFFGATRAPKELEISLTLQRRGVPTPEIVAYATYPADAFRRRADVVTREIPRSRDLLAALIGADSARKQAAAAATGHLLHVMALAGVRHPDLNVKNILLADAPDGAFEAYVLDVDRVWFDAPGSPGPALANWRRFRRSVQKHRDEIGDGFDMIFTVQ
jgi:tRNA A-37 threonylcarbamoyl transferase component Bud32